VALSHGQPASAGTSRDICGTLYTDKRNSLLLLSSHLLDKELKANEIIRSCLAYTLRPMLLELLNQDGLGGQVNLDWKTATGERNWKP
jgi:hypothetical protein